MGRCGGGHKYVGPASSLAPRITTLSCSLPLILRWEVLEGQGWSSSVQPFSSFLFTWVMYLDIYHEIETNFKTLGVE